VPTGTVGRERKEADGSLTWSLDVPASPASRFRATLTMSVTAKGNVTLPPIDLRPGNRPMSSDGVVQTFGLTNATDGVQLEGASLAYGEQLAALRSAWPGEAERLRRAGGSTWVGKGGRTSLVFPASKGPSPPVTKPPAGANAIVEAPGASRSHWVAAAAWCGTVTGVLLLFVRAPRSTWPEQVGLLGGLLGFAVTGQFSSGLVAYVAARMIWLLRIVLSARS
jgi:hypothetical protein